MDNLKTLIKKDCAAYSGMNWQDVKFNHILVRYIKTPGFKVTCHMRYLNKISHHKGLLYFLERIHYRNLQVKYGIQIGYKLTVGGGFSINHYGGIVIGQGAHIGENFNIRHNTTIGHVNGKNPTIGNNVTLGADVDIIGGITIGDDAMVGAGAVVVKDVAPHEIVAGNPAKVIGYTKGHPQI